MGEFIEIRNLAKIYQVGDEKVVALRKINLSIPKGQICCVLGTSGSGKSTLLNMLAGLEKPTKGRVVIGETNVSALDEKSLALFRQDHIGFVFQSYNLLPTITAWENVALPLVFRGMDKAGREKAAQKMLKRVGLADRALHKPTEMSGGQQQRVGIARAFVSRPSLVFADEPTGNLDTKTSHEVMSLMVRMAKKYRQTLVIVTHDSEVARYSDRIIHIIDGVVDRDEPNRNCLLEKEGREHAEKTEEEKTKCKGEPSV